jgi:hypothetical protein
VPSFQPFLSKKLLFLFLAGLCIVSCKSSNQYFIAITHVTVIDGTSSPSQPDSTVLIKDSRILSIGPSSSTQIPRNAKIVDATGKFLIPGLADMHVHLLGAGEPSGSREFILPLLVANGITTVRDMGGDVTLLKQLREEINSGKRPGPQIFLTGPYLDGNPPYFQPSIVVQTPAQAANAVQQLHSQGVDFIKVQSRLQPDPYFAIAHESQKLGLRFVGHVPDSITAAQASDAGQSSIEHLTGVLLGSSSLEEQLRNRKMVIPPAGETARQIYAGDQAWTLDLLHSYSQRNAAQLFQKFASNHTWQVPTLPLLMDLVYLNHPHDPQLRDRSKYLPGNVAAIWGPVLEKNSKSDAQDFVIRAQLAERSLAIVKEMSAAGVNIMAGSDSSAPNIFPGFSLHDDLAYMVQAGLTPLQALQTATTKPAEFLQRSAQQGSIAAGRRADLVLLNGNPLDDIHNTQKIEAVILNGKLLDRAALDSLLGNVQRYAAQ